MQDYEKLGAFYLGKSYDREQQSSNDDLLLYDSKDLTTHAVCVGMTGSGKTGLCLSLLEEAAIDGIPAIAIDPKGDLGNLFLTFPDLTPADFEPWIDAGEAARKGRTVEQYASDVATKWKDGLASWDQSPERIQKFRDSVDMAIYTPGSTAGIPLALLKSFDAPGEAILEDAEAFNDRVSTSTSGLLALLGINADPIKSREHILISNILTHAWKQGRSLNIEKLIGEIQKPPFEKVGIIDLESFFSAKDRLGLAMTLNNLLASPSFANWLEGEPLDIKRLLYTEAGKPRLSVISIAHMSESERMFFVTILLNEVLAWVRAQPGTSSLRALLYMDEVFGYFPPTANPPSKKPMLTLLKQARAYGLGVVLATQNPVDLDYKGLSNTGTWFLGRLQTERDKKRVLEGLEGASSSSGTEFNRQEMEQMLAGLGSRVFLMNNVHDDEPVMFETRWAMSYLRGPLTRKQISVLMEEKKQLSVQETSKKEINKQATPQKVDVKQGTPEQNEPALPPQVTVHYLCPDHPVPEDSKLIYRPSILGRGKLHFVRSIYKVDTWQNRILLLQVTGKVSATPWEDSIQLSGPGLELTDTPLAGATFAPLAKGLTVRKNYTTWMKKLKTHFYQTESLPVFKCGELKKYSEAGETEGDFRVRLRQLAHEERDLRVEKLRKKYSSKLNTLKTRIKAAQTAVDREKSQASRAKVDSAISFGTSLLGSLFGRRRSASASMRSASRAYQQHGDIARAREKVADLNEKLHKLESDFENDVEKLEESFDVDNLKLEALQVKPRKTDTDVAEIPVVWLPYQLDSSGFAEPLYELPELS